MSNTLTDIFNKKYQEIQDYYTQWQELQWQIKQLLGNPHSEETQSIVETDTALQESIKQFKHEIDNPLITLATTGTTSSGKKVRWSICCAAQKSCPLPFKK